MVTATGDFFAKGCGRCARFDTPACSALTWQAGVLALRRICLDAGLTETVKWGHPCYMHAGRNIVLIGALRGDFRLNFFNAALMRDPDGVLERQGPNTAHPDSVRFTDVARVAALDGTLRAYLAEAMGYAEAGLVAPKAARAVELAAELADELAGALDADPMLAEAFYALTAGRQRSYAIALSSAKTPETRRRRVAGYAEKILSGKGATER